jgi:hypothetical protein
MALYIQRSKKLLLTLVTAHWCTDGAESESVGEWGGSGRTGTLAAAAHPTPARGRSEASLNWKLPCGLWAVGTSPFGSDGTSLLAHGWGVAAGAGAWGSGLVLWQRAGRAGADGDRRASAGTPQLALAVAARRPLGGVSVTVAVFSPAQRPTHGHLEPGSHRPRHLVWRTDPTHSLFVRLISHQPAVLLSQNKPATSNQPAVLFSQNKSTPAISHQPNEQAAPGHPRIVFVAHFIAGL